MELAKPYLDVGVYTDRYDEMRRFYVEDLGLAYEELLKVGGGIHQHRLSLNGAVLKVNSSREPLADAPTNFRALRVRCGRTGAVRDPDGNTVDLTEHGATRITWASSNVARLERLLVEGLHARPLENGILVVGETEIRLDSGGCRAGPMRSRGIRYLTVQVRDVRVEHARLLDLGWQELRSPARLGDTAFVSFVVDPDGSPLEVSQRASLTGPLPDA